MGIDKEVTIVLVDNIPVFTRPTPATHPRSSISTSSSGADTPPLTSYDSSSQSDGSQSSIDLSSLNIILSNATHPMASGARARARARVRGHGHRRRQSGGRISRSQVYETIEEEMSSGVNSPVPSAPSIASKKSQSSIQCETVFIVDPDMASVDVNSDSHSAWDDETGIIALRRYYALRDEAQDALVESKRVWEDTPFSLFAVQCTCCLI
jgi:serine/arginine repetitive matrix protein 2